MRTGTHPAPWSVIITLPFHEDSSIWTLWMSIFSLKFLWYSLYSFVTVLSSLSLWGYYWQFLFPSPYVCFLSMCFLPALISATWQAPSDVWPPLVFNSYLRVLRWKLPGSSGHCRTGFSTVTLFMLRKPDSRVECLSIAFAASYRVLYVVFSFSWISKCFLISIVISSWTHWLFNGRLSHFHIVVNFPWFSSEGDFSLNSMVSENTLCIL